MVGLTVLDNEVVELDKEAIADEYTLLDCVDWDSVILDVTDVACDDVCPLFETVSVVLVVDTKPVVEVVEMSMELYIPELDRCSVLDIGIDDWTVVEGETVIREEE